MKRTHRFIPIITKFVLGLALLTTLSSCSFIFDTKLEKPNFTSFYIGNDDSIPQTEIFPISLKKRSSFPTLLRFSKWEKSNLSNLETFELSFALFDDKGTSYLFGEYGDSMLIKVMKNGSTKTSYYSVDFDLDVVLNRTLIPMHLIEATKAELVKFTFLSGDIVPKVTNSALYFDISAEDNLKLKDTSKIEEWENIDIPIDLQNEHEAMILLPNDKTLWFGEYDNGYIAQYHLLVDGIKTIYSYRISDDIFESILKSLNEIRTSFFDGPSQRVTNANHSSSYVWLGVNEGMVAGWKFPLSRVESDTLKPLMKIDQWMKIEKEIVFDLPSMCIYSEGRDSFCYVTKDNLLFVEVKSLDDPSIEETYYIPEASYEVVRTSLLTYWVTPVMPNEVKTFSFTKNEIIYEWNEDDGTVLSDKYPVSSGQMSSIKSLLRVDEWTLEKQPAKYFFGWTYKYKFENINGSSIMVFDFGETTVFKVESIIPNVGEDGAWYYGPKEIFADLSKYMTTSFPKK